MSPSVPARPGSSCSAPRLHLVTGATGLLGSHIAERLIARGDRVRALVRPSSDVSYLQGLGAELLRGDLTSADDCRSAVCGVDAVYHSAAKVGDWGRWAEFQTSCLRATETLAQAALREGVRRFVHISSTSAYGHPPDRGRPIDESHPLGVGTWWPWDYYTRSKVESERILWQLAADRRLPLTVIRPSWLYGERDRTTVARLVRKIERGGIPVLGRGDNPLSAIYAGDVAAAAILAADDPGSAGEAYNVTDQGPITQREFFEHFARACGSPRRSWTTRLWHPYGAAFLAGLILETHGRLTGRRDPPLLSRYAAWLMGRRISYSTAKIRERLGWAPPADYGTTIRRAVDWYRARSLDQGPGRSHQPSQIAP
jgi:nucleoside-diphosphate-sugar epimerase